MVVFSLRVGESSPFGLLFLTGVDISTLVHSFSLGPGLYAGISEESKGKLASLDPASEGIEESNWFVLAGTLTGIFVVYIKLHDELRSVSVYG